MLKPCLVLGSGFHKHVLSRTIKTSPLSDWNFLINSVSMNYGVVHHKSLNSKLAAKWELLLLELGARGQVTSEKEEGRSRYGNSIYLIESEAKKIAAKILIEEQTLNRNSYTKDLVPRDACWGSVVSLNFDTSWFSTKPPRVMRSPQIGYDSIRTPELRRMYGFHLARFLERSPIRVWHPNGCVSHPKSLRLGIREFGLQIDSINEPAKFLNTASQC